MRDQILRQIKYNYVHRERISSFLYGDIKGAKQLLDVLCLSPEGESGLHGFIQEIKLTPFGFLIISDIQVLSITL